MQRLACFNKGGMSCIETTTEGLLGFKNAEVSRRECLLEGKNASVHDTPYHRTAYLWSSAKEKKAMRKEEASESTNSVYLELIEVDDQSKREVMF